MFTRADAPVHEQGIESVSLTLDGAVDSDRFSEWVESQVALLGGRLMRISTVPDERCALTPRVETRGREGIS